MDKADTQYKATTIVDFVKGLPEYEDAPRGEKREAVAGKSSGAYGQNRHIPVHRLRSTIRVAINRAAGPENIELPAGSEVHIYRKFPEGDISKSRQSAEASIATIFFPRGTGQLTVTASLRSILKVFSSRK